MIDDALYRHIRLQAGVRTSAPVIERGVGVSDQRIGARFLGIDPIADTSLRTFASNDDQEWPVVDLLTTAAVVVSADLADHVIDNVIPLRVDGRSVSLPVLRILPSGSDAPSRTLIADIATAQQALGLDGRLSRVDLRLADDDPALDRVRALLPTGVTVESAARRAQSVRRLTRAFETNLVALSLLCLIVGTFLVYNTTVFLVLLRREQFGTLRALGVTPNEVRRAVLLEVATLALVGTLLGLLLGTALAGGLLQLVAQTINDLYFSTAVSRLTLSPVLVAKAALVGLVVSLAAAWLPASEAAAAPPRRSMQRWESERVAAARRRWLLPAAACFGLAAAGILFWPHGGLIAGLLGLFALIAAAVCAVPPVLAATLAGLQRALQLRARGGLSIRLAAGALSRTSVAAAALMVAIATTLGIGLMIDSFRGSVDQWLQRLLQADAYISAAGRGGALERRFAEQIATLPGVASVTTARRSTLRWRDTQVDLIAYDLNPRGYSGFEWLEGAPTFADFRSSGAAAISEPFANRFSAAVGDRLTVPTTTGGEVQLEVIGVYRDYGAQQGVIAIDRSNFDRWFEDDLVSGIGVYLDQNVSPSAFQASLEAATPPGLLLDVASNREIRAMSLRIFDRTFLVTEVLRALTALVAFLGILGALMAVTLEKRREYATLRALGMTPAGVRRSMIAQSGLVGAIAGVLAVPLGLLFALGLIHAVNVRAFGWSMNLSVDAVAIAMAVAAALLAAVLAALYPARRIAAAGLAKALRSE